MHKRDEALKKVPLNINDTLNAIQQQINRNSDRISAAEIDLKVKVSKAQLETDLRTKLDVTKFTELVPEGTTPKQYFSELLTEAIKTNGDMMQN